MGVKDVIVGCTVAGCCRLVELTTDVLGVGNNVCVCNRFERQVC